MNTDTTKQRLQLTAREAITVHNELHRIAQQIEDQADQPGFSAYATVFDAASAIIEHCALERELLMQIDRESEIVQQFAMYMQRREIIDAGMHVDGTYHPTWDGLGATGQAEYIRDAQDFMAAMTTLAPKVAPFDGGPLVDPTTAYVPLQWVLDNFKDGDERGWAKEFEFLHSNHRERLSELRHLIDRDGMTEPIELGVDGRVWNGHHRLCLAWDNGMTHVPVTFPTAQPARGTMATLQPIEDPADFSTNSRAEAIMGLRRTDVFVVNFPAEIGYVCPVHREETNDDNDGILQWSEYNSFLWCALCNKDYPSALCCTDLDLATEVYLDTVAASIALRGKDGVPND